MCSPSKFSCASLGGRCCELERLRGNEREGPGANLSSLLSGAWSAVQMSFHGLSTTAGILTVIGPTRRNAHLDSKMLPHHRQVKSQETLYPGLLKRWWRFGGRAPKYVQGGSGLTHLGGFSLNLDIGEITSNGGWSPWLQLAFLLPTPGLLALFWTLSWIITYVHKSASGTYRKVPMNTAWWIHPTHHPVNIQKKK